MNIPSLEGSGAEGHGDIQAGPGTRIAGLPEHFFKFAAMYRVTSQIRIGGDIQLYGSQVVAGNETKNTTADNNQAVGKNKLAGYSILNLNANYEYVKGLNFFARVNNVFDKKYASYASLGYNMVDNGQIATDADQVRGSVFYAPGAPRAVFGGVRYEWK